MLTITALRRLGDDAERAEPPGDPWPRLLVRIESPRREARRPGLASPLAGLGLITAIVAVLVLPLRLSGTGPLTGPTSGTRSTFVSSPVSAIERVVEAQYILSVRQRITPSSEAPAEAGHGFRIYPDNIRPLQKEVDSAEPTGRSLEAI